MIGIELRIARGKAEKMLHNVKYLAYLAPNST